MPTRDPIRVLFVAAPSPEMYGDGPILQVGGVPVQPVGGAAGSPSTEQIPVMSGKSMVNDEAVTPLR